PVIGLAWQARYTSGMETKTYIWIGIFLGSIVGGGIGSIFDHGNVLGLWSLLLGTVGSIVGIWAGWRLGNG
ncbi:MAG TPA: hypothetical protein VLF87_01305, partial [Patescibacteria group bacterium]|nr:hypothetical protein [Patescibacteria group bacterium]